MALIVSKPSALLNSSPEVGKKHVVSESMDDTDDRVQSASMPVLGAAAPQKKTVSFAIDAKLAVEIPIHEEEPYATTTKIDRKNPDYNHERDKGTFERGIDVPNIKSQLIDFEDRKRAIDETYDAIKRSQKAVESSIKRIGVLRKKFEDSKDPKEQLEQLTELVNELSDVQSRIIQVERAIKCLNHKLEDFIISQSGNHEEIEMIKREIETIFKEMIGLKDAALPILIEILADLKGPLLAEVAEYIITKSGGDVGVSVFKDSLNISNTRFIEIYYKLRLVEESMTSEKGPDYLISTMKDLFEIIQKLHRLQSRAAYLKSHLVERFGIVAMDTETKAQVIMRTKADAFMKVAGYYESHMQEEIKRTQVALSNILSGLSSEDLTTLIGFYRGEGRGSLDEGESGRFIESLVVLKEKVDQVGKILSELSSEDITSLIKTYLDEAKSSTDEEASELLIEALSVLGGKFEQVSKESLDVFEGSQGLTKTEEKVHILIEALENHARMQDIQDQMHQLMKDIQERFKDSKEHLDLFEPFFEVVHSTNSDEFKAKYMQVIDNLKAQEVRTFSELANMRHQNVETRLQGARVTPELIKERDSCSALLDILQKRVAALSLTSESTSP